MQKKLLQKVMTGMLAACVIFTSVNVSAATTVSMTNTVSANSFLTQGSSFESAYVEWEPIADAEGYNVYYRKEDSTSYTQIDSELIRTYNDYMRADVTGIAAGNYVIKVVPVIDGALDETLSLTSKTLSVTAHVREGFGFSENSAMGTSSGGYNDDGTVPSDAQILYISAENVNTVTLDVITNSKGKTTTCTGLTDILAKRQKGYDKTPLIIRMIGMVSASDISGLNSKGYLQLKGCYNVTLEGIGEDATVNGWGILIRGARNVEVRNLGIMLFPDDAISLDTDNENIWIHNNDIFYGTAGSDADQAKGDGSCDVKGNSTYVTVSFNHFWDSGKCSLCGMSDTEEFFVTYHHNWFDHSDSRHPRIRVGTVHIYNNYFDGNSKYGVGVTKGSSAFVEANYFRNCKYPMLSSLQGSDIAGSSTGTFSGEAGGMIKAYNNTIIGASSLIYANEDATQFDAYLATSRDEQVPSSYKTVSGKTTYNNFDTDSSVMYDYTPDAPEDVVSVVTAFAGRVNGGDFTWNFNDNTDDTSYKLNSALMSAIKAYASSLVSIGGGSIDADTVFSEAVEGVEDTGDTEVTEDTEVTGDSGNAGDTEVIGDTENTGDTEVTEDTENTGDSEITEDTGNTGDSEVTEDTGNTGDSEITEDTGDSEVTGGTTSAVYTHSFDASGLNSDFFTIKGKLSDSKGSVSFNGTTYTTCLKIESSTSVKFTTESASTLTLVFGDNTNKKIVIDGTAHSIVNGVLSIELGAGTHTITKENPVNLYYIEVAGK